MKIIFFKGVLDTIDLFTDKLVDSCKYKKIEYYIIDANDETTLDTIRLLSFMKNDNCVVFTFNMIGVLLPDPYTNENFWEKHNVSVYSWLVDHPRSFRDVCEKPISNLTLLCVDRDHIRFIKRWYPNIKNVYFLPHGGEGKSGSTKKYMNREFSVIYVGDCSPDVSLPDIPFLANPEEFYSDVIATMLIEPSLSTEDAIDRVLASIQSDFDYEQLKYLHFTCAGYIWCIVRREFQLRSIYALDKAGIRVDIFGTSNSWISNKYGFSEKIVLHGRISPYSCLDIMADSKILLNNMLGLKNGSHERVFNSQLCHALCVTDDSSFLCERRKNGYDIVSYDLNNLEEMVEKVSSYIEDQVKAEEVAENGFRIANNCDRWDNRFEEFLCISSMNC